MIPPWQGNQGNEGRILGLLERTSYLSKNHQDQNGKVRAGTSYLPGREPWSQHCGLKKRGVQKEPSQLASAYMEVRMSTNKARQQPCPA